MEYLVLNVRQPELADDARTDAEIVTAGIGQGKPRSWHGNESFLTFLSCPMDHPWTFHRTVQRNIRRQSAVTVTVTVTYTVTIIE